MEDTKMAADKMEEKKVETVVPPMGNPSDTKDHK